MTAAKGFGSLTGANFTFTGDPNLAPNSTFQIIGTSLWFNGQLRCSPADFGGGPQPVPEPSTWAMLILSGFLPLRRPASRDSSKVIPPSELFLQRSGPRMASFTLI